LANASCSGESHSVAALAARVFMALLSENEAFLIRHYADNHQQPRGPQHFRKFHGKPADGVLYFRAQEHYLIGGCTAHNAKSGLNPHNVIRTISPNLPAIAMKGGTQGEILLADAAVGLPPD
jgi:hypothetical protein